MDMGSGGTERNPFFQSKNIQYINKENEKACALRIFFWRRRLFLAPEIILGRPCGHTYTQRRKEKGKEHIYDAKIQYVIKKKYYYYVYTFRS